MREVEHRPQLPSTTLPKLRRDVGLSQRELARRAGVAPNTIRNAERGVIPTVLNQRAIVSALNRARRAHGIKSKLDRYDVWTPVPAEAAA